MRRWSSDEMDAIKRYLETRPEESFTRTDHHLAVEWLAQRYLPDNLDRTEKDHQKILSAFYEKIDAKIDRIERGEAEEVNEIKPDSDFANWMKGELMTRVDREDINKMLACFDQEDDFSHQSDSIKIFEHWLNNPDNFHIDNDLREKIESVVKAWNQKT